MSSGRGVARERVAFVLFLADREQSDPRLLHFQHEARINLAHQAELRSICGSQSTLAPTSTHHHRRAFMSGENAGKRRAVHAGNFAQHHLGDGHAGAGVAGGEEAIGFAVGGQAGADVHRTVLFAAGRFGGVIVHGDALGGMHHFDGQSSRRRDVYRAACSTIRAVANQKDPMPEFARGVYGALNFGSRGFVAPHRVYCNGDHSA